MAKQPVFSLHDYDGIPSGKIAVRIVRKSRFDGGGICLEFDGNEECGYLTPERARALAAWLLEAAEKQEGR